MSVRSPGSRDRIVNLQLALPRLVATGITLRYGNIRARAEEIWVLDDTLECVIDGAGPPGELPTAHDRDHAAVVSFLASQQPQFSSLRCTTALLHYRNSTRRGISVDLDRAKAMCDRASSSSHKLRQPIPAALVGFLCGSAMSANFVCGKRENSQFTDRK